MTYFKAKRIERWQHYVYLPNGLFPIPAAIKKIRLFGAETDRGYLAYRKYNITWSFLECRAMVIPQMLERERLKKSKKEAAP